MPPHCPTSSWMICAACFSSTRANSYFVTRRSPVAMGMLVWAATRAISSTFSGITGSSNQNGWYGSRYCATRMAL